MSWIEALLLGLIQGLSEFLPISSSGHLELGKALLGVEAKDPLLFSIAVHGATALSTVVVYRKVILDLFRDALKFQWNEGTRYLLYIVLSMIPVFFVGVFFEEQLEALFTGQIVFVGAMLILTAILLYSSTKMPDKGLAVNPKRAFIIGLAQAIAVLPGISRSGATISTALICGVDRERAARFSFLMVLPPILGACLLKLKDYFEEGSQVAFADEKVGLIVGFIAAFVSGWAACTWMISIVKKAKLQYFAYYCALAGCLAIASNWF